MNDKKKHLNETSVKIVFLCLVCFFIFYYHVQFMFTGLDLVWVLLGVLVIVFLFMFFLPKHL